MADLLIDSDVLVDHLRGVHRLVRSGDRLHCSVITRAELFAGNGTEEGRVRRLLEPLRELPVDRAIAERAGRLRRLSGLRAPDALIAATAIEHALTLVTRNRRDFASVKGLTLRVPR